MITITVSQNENVATFKWNDNAKECDYTAIGFTDAEVDAIIESKAHMGTEVEGYEVEVVF
jgi:hypothetical protein